ncbi:MAG TPA: zinc ABC transporter substrate-binding protein, partial [Aestuariivirgaceae bacterium]
MKRMTIIAGLIISVPLSLAASAASAKTLTAIASFSILADVVKEVGGKHVEVKSLVQPNGDPHQFEPSPDDAKALKAADVTFVSGEGLEGWFEKLAGAAGYKG